MFKYDILKLMDIIDVIKCLLVEEGITQTEFAKRIGVKQSQVSEWLKGKSKPAYDNLRAICLAFGVSGDFVLGITLD